MFGLFKKKEIIYDPSEDFSYLNSSDVYFDSACQTLRPKQVVEAMQGYYYEFNSCGERVRYQWGKKVDELVDETRENVIHMLGLSPRKYFTSFTLNTTYGINLVLGQFKAGQFKKVVTSETEHNSVFLSTMSFAKKHDIERVVLEKNSDGSIDIDGVDFTDALVVLGAVSNFDARQLINLKKICQQIHKQGGVLVIDAAQAMSHCRNVVKGIEADVICFSSHKMYGPSLGVIVARRDIVDRLEVSFIGGGMVDDVNLGGYQLSASANEDNIHTVFEPGLQAYAEIIGLGEAIKWLDANYDHSNAETLGGELIEFLRSVDSLHVINKQPSTTVSFYSDKHDSALLADALADSGIMARSGYFCAHYYLQKKMELPHLVRISVGMNNTQTDMDKLIKSLQRVR